MEHINVKDAATIAMNACNKVDTLQEYADAYHFYEDGDDIVVGGCGVSVIVMKDGGRIVPWADYFMRKEDVIEIGGLRKIKDIIEGDD